MKKKVKAKKVAVDHPYQIGKSYFIRTVTMYYTGKLESVLAGELVLSSAAWIADTGRLSDALRSGIFNEIEPFPGDVVVSRGCITDASVWLHPLPVSQK